MASPPFPWRNGYWKNKADKIVINLYMIQNEDAEYKMHHCLDFPEAKSQMSGKLISGSFGPTSSDIREASGIDTFNLQWEISKMNLKMQAVLSENGRCIHKHKLGQPGVIEALEWLDGNQLQELKENREPLEAPTLPPYIILAPDYMGKIVWFSEPAGSGKSTTAQLMGRNHGYVYYEADGFLFLRNPFVDLYVDNPTMALANQKPLKSSDVSVIKSIEKALGVFGELMQGNLENNELLNSMFTAMAHHIAGQRKRIGGNWAIAQACPTGSHREAVRKILGPDLVFIVLKLSQEVTFNRLSQRFAGRAGLEERVEKLMKTYEIFEDAEKDEKDAYNLVIDEDMGTDDVISKVLEIVEKN